MNQNLFFTDTAWGTKIDDSGENLSTTYNPFAAESFEVPADALIRFEFGPNVGYGYVVGIDKRIYNPIVNNTIQHAFLTVDDVDEISKTLTADEVSNYVKVTGIAVAANTLSEGQINESEKCNEADDPTEGGKWVKVEEEDDCNEADDPTEGGKWVKVEEEDEIDEADEWIKVDEDDDEDDEEDIFPSRVTESHSRLRESRRRVNESRLRARIEERHERFNESRDIFSRLRESREPTVTPSRRVTESRLRGAFNRLCSVNEQINESRNISVITFDEFCKELAIAFPDDSDVKNLRMSGFSKVTFVTPEGTVNARMVEGALTFVAFEDKNNKLIAFDDGEFNELLQVTEFVKVHK